MFLNARQLEQLLRETGGLALPIGAKLTPAAQDLVRARKLDVRYGAAPPATSPGVAPAAKPTTSPAFLWWSGATSGTAKAALAMTSRESNLREMPTPPDATKTASAVRHLVGEVKAARVAGGILVVESSGLAALLANRSPHLRAVVGTSLAGVDAGIREVAANVLIVEPGATPLMVLRNMILRFVRGPRVVGDELGRSLSEAANP